jgi:glutaredoxin
MKLEHVSGKNKGSVVLYALSTCIWCRKTKELLGDLGVEYDYVFVDLLSEDDQQEAQTAMTKWNPDLSFPTMVIDNSHCIVGFKPEEIKKHLGK